MFSFVFQGDLTDGFLRYELGGFYLEEFTHGWAYFRSFTEGDEHSLHIVFFFWFFDTVRSTFVLVTLVSTTFVLFFRNALWDLKIFRQWKHSLLQGDGVFDSVSREIRCFVAFPAMTPRDRLERRKNLQKSRVR